MPDPDRPAQPATLRGLGIGLGSGVRRGDLVLADPGLGGRTPWLVAALPAALSVPVFMAYLRFLRQADELVRRVQLEGLAVGFGAGVLLAIGYPLFASAGAPPLDVSAAAVVMTLAWVVGQIAASARYR